MAKVSRRLVIDASVARAAGGPAATFPLSKQCRDFLSAVLTISHRVVMTPAIIQEWNIHQSDFARSWRASMVARRKLYLIADPPPYAELLDKLARLPARPRAHAAMEKDFHLIIAALETDRTVASCDDAARTLFATAARTLGELQAITWVHPGTADIVAWLQGGALPEKGRLLGIAEE